MDKSSTNNPSGAEQGVKKEAIVEQAKHAVTHVADQAKEQRSSQLNTQFDTRKDKAFETMGNVADAIRGTSEKLKGVGPLGDVAERAADGIESVAAFFEGKKLGDLVRDVERFARREPALFLGATFALGLIGGRFLKSSTQSSMQRSGRGASSDAGESGYAYDREGVDYDREGVYDTSYADVYGTSYADEYGYEYAAPSGHAASPSGHAASPSGHFSDGEVEDDDPMRLSIFGPTGASSPAPTRGRTNTLPLGTRSRSGPTTSGPTTSGPTTSGPTTTRTGSMAGESSSIASTTSDATQGGNKPGRV